MDDVTFTRVRRGSIEINVALAGDAGADRPLILCVHGWPELWYSWRHQLTHFAGLGFRVAAMDVRGYGGSSKPDPIAAYTMRELTADVAAVIDDLGGGPAILFGHDWGAPIAWHTALLHPDRVRAVAGLSVPYAPRGEVSLLQVTRAIYGDRFFYMHRFQEEGRAEAEFETDLRHVLRCTYHSLSGDAPVGTFLVDKPADAPYLEGLAEPESAPAWMTEADLDVYVDAFRRGGMRGPMNRYRAQELDFEELAELADARIEQPACFIAGEADAVRSMAPGRDMFAEPGAACADYRGTTLLPGVGHWVQQEAPEATNRALEAFVSGL